MGIQCTPRQQNGRYQLAWPTSMSSVQDEFDRLLDRFASNDNSPRSDWLARVDLWEDENAYHFEFDAPGLKSAELEMTVEKGVLQITAKREEVEASEERKYLHRERRYGQAERRITLPDTANADDIEAELTAGVLHVTVAKKEEVQPKRITVKG